MMTGGRPKAIAVVVAVAVDAVGQLGLQRLWPAGLPQLLQRVAVVVAAGGGAD